jgi:hypothetical protein
VTTPENWLLCNRLKALALRLAEGVDDAEADAIWTEAEDALAAADAEEDADIALPILERSLPEVQALIAGWDAGTAHLAEWDRAVLKRALKAYRKRLKLMRLDDESTAARNPLSRGGESAISGIRPPEQYPQEIWDFLVAQGKLRDAGQGLYELTTG